MQGQDETEMPAFGGRTTEHLISQTSGRRRSSTWPHLEVCKPAETESATETGTRIALGLVLELGLGLEWIRPHIDLCQRH